MKKKTVIFPFIVAIGIKAICITINQSKPWPSFFSMFFPFPWPHAPFPINNFKIILMERRIHVRPFFLFLWCCPSSLISRWGIGGCAVMGYSLDHQFSTRISRFWVNEWGAQVPCSVRIEEEKKKKETKEILFCFL